MVSIRDRVWLTRNRISFTSTLFLRPQHSIDCWSRVVDVATVPTPVYDRNMESNPYQATTTKSLEGEFQRKHPLLVGVGLLLYSGPIWGTIVTVIGMVRSFGVLAENGSDPAELSDSMSVALVGMMIGLGVGVVGAIWILVLLLVYKVKSRPFFWWAIALSMIWCVVIFPYGLIVGLGVGSLFWTKRLQV